MNSGGSSSGKAPVQPQPQGSQTTPYGNATPFNPVFQSYLPPEGSMASAQLGDVPRQETGPPTPLLQQQQATPMVADRAGAGAGISSGMRRMLAEMMVRAERDKYLKGVNRESAGGGSQARGSFGPGGGSKDSWGGLR